MAVEGDELRKDHLSPYARAQHRNLLIAASVGFLFVVVDPNRISALGVSLESSRRGWILLILLAAVIYFEFAFLAGSRADSHVWRRGLSKQRAHLDALKDATAFERGNAQLDENLADGEAPAEIERRRQELRATHDEQLATREHLVPIVRWFAVRGWVPVIHAIC